MNQEFFLNKKLEVKKVTLRSDIEIAYIDIGSSSEVILCIHGLGSNKKAFIKNWDYLSNYFRVICLDLPNYGDSSKGDYPSTIDFFSNIVLDFIKILELPKITLCGHSMGGHIALNTALNFPDYIDKIILIAPAGLEKFTPQEIEKLSKFLTYDAIKNMSDSQIEFNVKLNFFSFPEDAEFMIKERIEVKQKSDFHFYCLTVSRAFNDMLNHPIIDFVEKLKQPTLLIFGENDELIPNKLFHPYSTTYFAHSISEKIPNSKLIIFPSCGHFVQFEKPLDFNQEVVNFLI